MTSGNAVHWSAHWRRLAAIAAIVPFTLAVSACGGSDASETSQGDDGQVRGSLRLAAEVLGQAGYDKVVDNFRKAHPDVDVKVEYAPAANRPHVVGTQFQSGNGPDVVTLNAGQFSPSIKEYQKAGYLADLSDREWVERTPKIAQPLVEVDGKTYGWLLRVITPSVMYDEKRFQELGLTIPKTHDEFLQLCRTIRAKDKDLIPFAWAGGEPSAIGGRVDVNASSLVYGPNPDWVDERSRGETTFGDTPGWREAAQMVLDLEEADCASPGAASDNYTTAIRQLATGKAVMLSGNDAFLGAIAAADDQLDVGLFPIPSTTEEGTYLTVAPADVIAINAKTKNMAAARAFVDFIAQPEQNEVLADTLGTLTAEAYERVADGKDEFDAIRKPFEPYADRVVVFGNTSWPDPKVFNAMGDAAQGLLTGQAGVDEVLKAADDAWPKAGS